MEKVSSEVEREIRVAAERAKVIFDRMGWTWYVQCDPPTVETLVEGITILQNSWRVKCNGF